MADTLIKMKAGSLSKIDNTSTGISRVPIEKGVVYFAIDSSTKAGRVWFDASDGTRIDMNAFAQQATNAVLAENVSGVVAITNGGTGAGTVSGALANFGLGNAQIFYGTCATAAGTTAKEVTCSNFTSTYLKKGAIIYVTFDNTNSGAVGSLTLNVNSTGAKPIKNYYNSSISNLQAAGQLVAGGTIPFTYDGTN